MYLSTTFSSEHSLVRLSSSKESGCESLDESAVGKVQMKDDNNGSGDVVVAAMVQEEPSKWSCKYPSPTSFNNESIEWYPEEPLCNFLRSCR